MFNEVFKVDYVNDSVVEPFNSKVNNQWRKFDLMPAIAVKKFEGHKILPSVLKDLNQ